jgi:hypothetical protein
MRVTYAARGGDSSGEKKTNYLAAWAHERGRMTQIMKLLHLAPDIQEQILFLPVTKGFNERNLRPIVRLIDWDEQRTLFRKMMARWMK